MDLHEKTEDSGNLIIKGEFYTLDNIKNMIPMLDEISYHKLFLQINYNYLSKREIEDEELLIKRLAMNDANTWKRNMEKFDNSNNKVEE